VITLGSKLWHRHCQFICQTQHNTCKHNVNGTGRTPEEQTFIELVPIVQYCSDTEL